MTNNIVCCYAAFWALRNRYRARAAATFSAVCMRSSCRRAWCSARATSSGEGCGGASATDVDADDDDDDEDEEDKEGTGARPSEVCGIEATEGGACLSSLGRRAVSALVPLLLLLLLLLPPPCITLTKKDPPPPPRSALARSRASASSSTCSACASWSICALYAGVTNFSVAPYSAASSSAFRRCILL
jgi:hypothetical protein